MMIAGAVEMAKRKVSKPGARVEYLQLRMSVPFKEWLQSYADSRNLTMADAIVQALIEEAARRGFKAPPKR